MLQVAACSCMLLDNWEGPKVHKGSIIRVCLLHDLGNILKIPENFSRNPNFLKVRKECIEKYGHDDNALNLALGKREGLTNMELEILNDKNYFENEDFLKSDNYDKKIFVYSDRRVAPYGIVGIKDRLEDVKERYKNKPWSTWSDPQKADYLIDFSLKMEKQLMQYCKIKPEDINDETVEYYIEKLKKVDIDDLLESHDENKQKAKK